MDLHKLSWWLVVVGALNWGLEALNFNVVNMLLGSMPMVEQGVYLLIGAAAVYCITMCKDCGIMGKGKR